MSKHSRRAPEGFTFRLWLTNEEMDRRSDILRDYLAKNDVKELISDENKARIFGGANQ